MWILSWKCEIVWNLILKKFFMRTKILLYYIIIKFIEYNNISPSQVKLLLEQDRKPRHKSVNLKNTLHIYHLNFFPLQECGQWHARSHKVLCKWSNGHQKQHQGGTTHDSCSGPSFGHSVAQNCFSLCKEIESPEFRVSSCDIRFSKFRNWLIFLEILHNMFVLICFMHLCMKTFRHIEIYTILI